MVLALVAFRYAEVSTNLFPSCFLPLKILPESNFNFKLVFLETNTIIKLGVLKIPGELQLTLLKYLGKLSGVLLEITMH